MPKMNKEWTGSHKYLEVFQSMQARIIIKGKDEGQVVSVWQAVNVIGNVLNCRMGPTGFCEIVESRLTLKVTGPHTHTLDCPLCCMNPSA